MPYNTFVINGTALMTFTEFKEQQDARNTIELNIVKYCLMLCDALQADYQGRYSHGSNYTFALDSSGRRYHKVFMYRDGQRDSIHAFIDKKTGSVYKPASFKAPAKHERYNVLRIESREEMFKRADWAGSYLYIR
jgi:hypothetical protein